MSWLKPLKLTAMAAAVTFGFSMQVQADEIGEPGERRLNLWFY